MQILLSSSAGIIGSRFVDVLGEKHNVLILESFELQIRAMDKSDYLTGTAPIPIEKGVQKETY